MVGVWWLFRHDCSGENARRAISSVFFRPATYDADIIAWEGIENLDLSAHGEKYHRKEKLRLIHAIWLQAKLGMKHFSPAE